MPKRVEIKKKPQSTEPANATVPMPTPASVDKPQDTRKIIYDRVELTEYSSTSPHGPLTVEDVKTMLWWETEKQYQARMVVEKPGSKPEHWLFGDDYHCLDTSKQKVRCWNNLNNRPFDMSWCEDLVHTILSGQWAGPLMLPGETINGETVRVSRYGRVISGQHQGTALILADELLQLSRAQPGNTANPKWPAWNGHKHPVIETVVITGLSEDERVLRSVDYVKPRTVADMLFTMELFRQNTSAERKEMTRMLAAAIDMLWTRTDTKGYRTHPEVVGFLERHKRLLKCVEHIFVENSAKGADGGRKISKLRLSAGHAAALCYLMGSAGPKTDGDVYRNESPPSEKNLDWSYWDQAQDFWVCLAGDRDFMPVRTALGRLIDSTTTSGDNQGLGGRLPEKLAILAKAWEMYKDHPAGAGPAFNMEDLGPDGALCLSYSDLSAPSIKGKETIGGNKLPDGQIRLLDVADFYGIDCPESIGAVGRQRRSIDPPDPPPPSPEEIEKATQEALERRRLASK